MSDDFMFWLVALSVAACAITAAAGVWVWARDAEHRQRLRLHGRTVVAHVSSLGSDPGDGLGGGGSYWAKVQYDDGGDFVTTKVSISRAEYESYRVGTGVQVTYLPGQPTSARRTAELARGPKLSTEDEERIRRLTR